MQENVQCFTVYNQLLNRADKHR